MQGPGSSGLGFGSMAGAHTAFCDETNNSVSGGFGHVARQVDLAGIEDQQGADVALGHLRRSALVQHGVLAGLNRSDRSQQTVEDYFR